jgi:hypothetical protein
MDELRALLQEGSEVSSAIACSLVEMKHWDEVRSLELA